jgi:hypothetical protein
MYSLMLFIDCLLGAEAMLLLVSSVKILGYISCPHASPALVHYYWQKVNDVSEMLRTRIGEMIGSNSGWDTANLTWFSHALLWFQERPLLLPPRSIPVHLSHHTILLSIIKWPLKQSTTVHNASPSSSREKPMCSSLRDVIKQYNYILRHYSEAPYIWGRERIVN